MVKRQKNDDQSVTVTEDNELELEKVDSASKRSICVSLNLAEQAMHGPAHSLEPNLILCFLYLAAKPLGITESEVLHEAQKDGFGYLSSWSDYSLLLKKAYWSMRPINVPFKPKWLRETAESLRVTNN